MNICTFLVNILYITYIFISFKLNSSFHLEYILHIFLQIFIFILFTIVIYDCLYFDCYAPEHRKTPHMCKPTWQQTCF